MKEVLNNVFNSVAKIPVEEINRFLSYGVSRTINSGQLYISEGDYPQKFAFAFNGLFRYFYIDRIGKEFTKNFVPAPSFVASYSAMVDGHKSYLFVEAIEDSEVIEIKYQDWLSIKNSHPCWDRFLLKQVERAFIVKEKRERELLLLNATERYNAFIEENPSLIDRLPHHLIASYLEIKPSSLRRIRKNTQSS